MNQDAPSLSVNGRDAPAHLGNEGKLDGATSDDKLDTQQEDSRIINSPVKRGQTSLNTSTIIDTHIAESKSKQQAITVGRFFSVCFSGSLEKGYFNSVNDVYVKYSIVAGPDWILSHGTNVGITQIARYRLSEDSARQFVWNQPITVSFRSYNYHGWPQLVVSVYNFDFFGNDQLIGYGCIHLPIINRGPIKQTVTIYSPKSTSYIGQLLSWITGRKPELVDSNLFARSDCRAVLQTVTVGQLELIFNLTSKDISSNAYRVS